MSKKQNKKFITPEILRGAVKGAFVKLNPRYMMRNPVMFVVEIGCFITLLLSFFPGLFGDVDAGSLRIYDIIVCVILFITVLFANFAEAVAEGRGKAQAASLKKTQKDTEAHLLHEDGSETIVRSSELKRATSFWWWLARSSPATARSLRASPPWMSPPSPASPPPWSARAAATSAPSPAAPRWCLTG